MGDHDASVPQWRAAGGDGVLSARVAVLARLLLQCRGGVARVCERMYRVRVNI
jgi:hypothetical protein